jgi:hypothetical protein
MHCRGNDPGPLLYANQLPQQVENLIVRLKAEKPHWGARETRELTLPAESIAP